VDFSEQGEPVAGTTTDVEDPKRATGWEAQPPHGAGENPVRDHFFHEDLHRVMPSR
jgi:alpha/beta superfamily hydrolase